MSTVLLASFFLQPLSGEIHRISLREALSLAEQNDFERTAREQKLRLSARAQPAMLRKYFPGFSVTWQSLIGQVKKDYDSRDQSVRADVNQLIWDGGQKILADSIASLNFQIEKEEFGQYQSEFVHQIRLAFLGALHLKAIRGIQESSVQLTKTQAAISKKENELGLSVETDYLFILSKYREAEKELVRLEGSWRNAISELKPRLGLDFETPVEIAGDLFSNIALFPPQRTFRELVDLAEGHHPSFKKNRIETIRSERDVLLSRLGSFPTVSLGAFYQLGGIAQNALSSDFGFTLSFSTPLGGNTTEGNYGLASRRNTGTFEESQSLKFNLLDNPLYFQSLEEKRLAMETARYQETRYRTDFKIKLENSLQQLALAFRSLELQKDLVSLLERRLKILEVRVNLGEAKRIDFVEDLVALQGKRNELSENTLGYIRQAAELELFLGLPLDSLGLVKIKEEK